MVVHQSSGRPSSLFHSHCDSWGNKERANVSYYVLLREFIQW